MIKNTLLCALILAGTNAFAEYSRLAECGGQTDKAVHATVTLMVNRADDTTGLILFDLGDGTVKASNTRIDWTTNPQGFPRFFDNEFDLDIVISETGVSTDDVLVGDDYIGQLNCSYRP